MSNPKKYGLILPKSKQTTSAKPEAKNVFGDDSDDEHSKSNIEQMIKKESTRNLSRLNTQLMLQKALNEDANVFEYDEVYDDMKTQKEEQDLANKVVTKDRKPKYIESLLKNANARKKEDERRQQRKIQKEREDEKEAFGDKEAFVTSAYKKKMEEMQKEEEEEKRKEQIEEMMDVTKQKDLSGFYRHLLKQQCGEEKIPETRRALATLEDEAETSTKKDDGDSDKDDAESMKEKPSKGTMARTYRKRKQQSDSEEEKPNEDADEVLESSSSDSEDEEDKADEDGKEGETSIAKAEAAKAEDSKPKERVVIDFRELFQKRCVGEKFDDARERYLERKAAKLGISVQ